MPNYSVEGADGQMYGPVDENGLVAWAREGRLAPNTRVRLDDTGGVMIAAEVPVLAVVFGRVQQPVQPQYPPAPAASYLHAQQPQYGGRPYGGGLPAFPHQVGYATPPQPYGTYGGGAGGSPGAHQLSGFPVVGVVLLHFFTCGIFSAFYWTLMHGKLPRNRVDDPSAARAFWFYWIPGFNLYWMFFCPLRLVTRIDEQRTMRGLAPSGVRGLMLTSLILLFIPYLGWMIDVVLVPVTFGLLQGKINELVYVGGYGGIAATPAAMGVAAQYPAQQSMAPVYR
jgi:hypothetical protein